MNDPIVLVRKYSKQSMGIERILLRKAFISINNTKARVNFSKEHKEKDSSLWRTVLFPGESKWDLDGSDGTVFMWRKPGEKFRPNYTKSTIKHTGKWGCFSYSSVGELV